MACRRLVLATGGHPSGRHLAEALGHGVVPPLPSLFTLRLQAPWLQELAGVSQAPVALELRVGEERFRQTGIVLLTHWGISGPALLRLTAFAARALHAAGYRAELHLDWTGGQDPGALREQLRQARRELARRQMGNGRPLEQLKRRLWGPCWPRPTSTPASPGVN